MLGAADRRVDWTVKCYVLIMALELGDEIWIQMVKNSWPSALPVQRETRRASKDLAGFILSSIYKADEYHLSFKSILLNRSQLDLFVR